MFINIWIYSFLSLAHIRCARMAHRQTENVNLHFSSVSVWRLRAKSIGICCNGSAVSQMVRNTFSIPSTFVAQDRIDLSIARFKIEINVNEKGNVINLSRTKTPYAYAQKESCENMNNGLLLYDNGKKNRHGKKLLINHIKLFTQRECAIGMCHRVQFTLIHHSDGISSKYRNAWFNRCWIETRPKCTLDCFVKETIRSKSFAMVDSNGQLIANFHLLRDYSISNWSHCARTHTHTHTII